MYTHVSVTLRRTTKLARLLSVFLSLCKKRNVTESHLSTGGH